MCGRLRLAPWNMTCNSPVGVDRRCICNLECEYDQGTDLEWRPGDCGAAFSLAWTTGINTNAMFTATPSRAAATGRAT
jgi:hypothetical protein